MTKCPHSRIQFCPLYVESHNGRGLGCVDDVGKDCKVDRGILKYQDMLWAVEIVEPKLPALCKFNEEIFQRTEQRARNMKLNGVH